MHVVRQFSVLRDEIFNYEQNTNTIINDAIKTSMLLNRLQGEVRAHLLLNSDMNKPDFNKAGKDVEDYYRNRQRLRDKRIRSQRHKGKRKRKTQPTKDKNDTQTTQVARKDTTTPTPKEKETG
eukprot:336795-Amphidinium_carterae.1